MITSDNSRNGAGSGIFKHVKSATFPSVLVRCDACLISSNAEFEA